MTFTQTILAVIIGNFASGVIGVIIGFFIGLILDRPQKPILYRPHRGGSAKEVEQAFRSKMQDPDANPLNTEPW